MFCWNLSCQHPLDHRKSKSSRKTSISALLTMPKPLTMWITTNWEILQEMGIPGHLNCLLRNLYAGQETPVRTGHGTTDWYQTGKGVHQVCILSPCLFNLYVEYIRRRQWHLIPVLLPGKSHGRRSLVDCNPCGCYESDMAEWLHFHFSLSCIGEGNGNPLQCSCLENPRDRGIWWAAVYGVAQSRTRLKQLSSSSSRVHYEKHWDGWSTSWDQDSWEKYQ